MKLYAIGEEGSYAVISSKGASVLSWAVGKTAIIFPQKIIEGKSRGGIPICFPFFGPPPARFSGLSKHGWLRDQELELKKQGENFLLFWGVTQGSPIYPWTLIYDVKVMIEEKNLMLQLKVERLRDGVKEQAPINPGFHPYFCNLGSKLVIIDDAQYWITGYDRSQIVPPGEKILIELGAKKVKMSLGGDFGEKVHAALWSDDNEYFCVEPILTLPADFDTPRGKFLEPGQMLKLSCSLSVFS